MFRNAKVVAVLACLVVISFLGGCAGSGLNINVYNSGGKLERTVSSYEAEGLKWGRKHWDEKPQRTPLTPPDEQFVRALIDYIDFFTVHAELKDAFKKGYRLGYQDRTADLVLGPHLTKAAEEIGFDTSKKFVDVIETFERGWAATLRHAIDVFIVLISEGSQKDREVFIDKFVATYGKKWAENQETLKSRKVMTQVSEGGTMLFIDYSKGKTLGALDVPTPRTLKKEIYQQTFKVMGDEWGRRYSTNLIKRDELVELLRRSKTVLDEEEPKLKGNLDIIRKAFVEQYGIDGINVYNSMLKDAGY